MDWNRLDLQPRVAAGLRRGEEPQGGAAPNSSYSVQSLQCGSTCYGVPHYVKPGEIVSTGLVLHQTEKFRRVFQDLHSFCQSVVRGLLRSYLSFGCRCYLVVLLTITEPQRLLMVIVCLEAKFKSVRDVLCVSALELQNLTGLSSADVQQLLTTAAAACRPHPPVPGFSLTCTLKSLSDKCSTGTSLFVCILRSYPAAARIMS